MIITVHVLKENRTKSDLSLWFRSNRWNYGKFHRFLSPFSSKFPDLNFAPYAPYIYSCYMKPVREARTRTCARIRVIDPGGRWGATSWKIGLGCASRFLKPLPYLRPKSVIFLTLFQTWSKVWYPISAMARDRITGKAVTARTRLEEEASSKKQNRFKTRVHKPYSISDQNGLITFFRPKMLKKKHTLWRRTFLYSLYKGGDWSF